MTPKKIKEIVKTISDESYIPEKSYPGNLPVEIQPWYAYYCNSGHSIVCCLKQYFEPGKDMTSELLPIPVKSVWRGGYEIMDGYIAVDLPYFSEIGLITLSEDEEY